MQRIQGLTVGNASAFELDALDTRIRELVAYARERDGEDRTLLFRNLVDLFLTGKAPIKQPTRDQLLDVIEAMIPHVEPDVRRTVAELVANLAAPPLDLAYRLAKDRPHIVGDLLLSTAFAEDDIIELIARTGRDHHHVIASRSDLSANVWIALARAAPAAPPFDNQSTLALWRDDLGAMHNDETIMPFRREEIPATTDSRPIQMAPETQMPVSNVEPQETQTEIPKAKIPQEDRTAPKPPVAKRHAHGSVEDNRNAAQLRILRTDKDLIADRLEKNCEKMQTGTILSEQVSAPVSDDTAARKPVALPARPGSWSWQSDRDGLVANVSNSGALLFDRSRTLVGGSILDMLGLQSKLGHPVSRAFQRRSTIHDAPIALENDDIKLRFWTLEATPIFSANGGTFEGYDGVMTPVSAHEQPSLDLPGPQAATAPDATLEAALFVEPAKTDQRPAANRQTMIDENIDRTVVPPPAASNAPSKIAPATGNSSSAGASVPVPSVAEKPADKPLANIAAEVLKDLIGDSVSAALGNSLRERQAEMDKVQSASEQTENDLQSTLHILEDTLANLIKASKQSGSTSVRLQTEIATACLKTLKEQLSDK